MAADDIRNRVEQKLIEIEKKTNKGLSKWKSTPYIIKERYLRSVITIPDLERCLFYSIFTNTRDYINATAETIAQVIYHHVEKKCQPIIVIDAEAFNCRVFADSYRYYPINITTPIL